MKISSSKIVLSAALLISSFGAAAKADDIANIVDVTSQNLFVPVGFDDNDDTVVVLDGYLPNSCYRVVDPVVQTDLTNHQITIQAKARHIDGIFCLDALIPYSKTVNLGTLPHGDYSIVNNGTLQTETLVIATATNAGPDDFLYAPVDAATIQTNAGGIVSAVLEGRFTNSCMTWDEPRITYTGKTIQLLPVITMGEENCQAGEFPFRKVILLNQMQAGRYLLHVRSLNGASVNKVFSVLEQGDPIQ